MTNLKPERRADKNGKLVTRHIRDTDSPSSKVSFPPPFQTAGSNPQRSALVDTVREALVRGDHGFVGVHPVARVYDGIHNLSDATVSAYTQEIELHPHDGLDELLIGVLNVGFNDHDARFMLEIAKFDSLGSSWSDSKGRRLFEVSRQVYLGLGCYSKIGYEAPDRITDKECPEIVNALAIAQLTIAIYNDDAVYVTGETVKGRIAMKLKDTGLVSLLLERPGDSMRIAAAVRERKTTDTGVIREMLDTGSANLQEGAL